MPASISIELRVDPAVLEELREDLADRRNCGVPMPFCEEFAQAVLRGFDGRAPHHDTIPTIIKFDNHGQLITEFVD